MFSDDPPPPEAPEPPDRQPPPRAVTCTRFAPPAMLICPPLLLASHPLLATLHLKPPPRLASPPLRLRHRSSLLLRQGSLSSDLPPPSPSADLPPSLPDDLLRSLELTDSTDLFSVVGSLWILTSLPFHAEIYFLLGRDWCYRLVALPPTPVPPDPPPDPPDAPLLSAQHLNSTTTYLIVLSTPQPFGHTIAPPLPLSEGLSISSGLSDQLSWFKTPPLRSPSRQNYPSLSFCSNFGPLLWLPHWSYLGLKPQASLLQIVIPAGFVLFPSWNLLVLVETTDGLGLHLHMMLLPQFEALEGLSTVLLSQLEFLERLPAIISDVTSFVACFVCQHLPPCEELLPLHEDTLPLYEDSLPQYEDQLPQYEDLLPHYEAVTQNLYSVFVQSFALLVLLPHDAGIHFRNMGEVFTIANLRLSLSDSVLRMWKFLFSQIISRLRISSKFPGSSRRCLVISIAKSLAASLALVAEACSGNVSPSVLSFVQDFISSSTVDVFILCCLNGLYVSIIYLYASRFASVAAVDYAGLAIVFCFSNFCSVFGE